MKSVIPDYEWITYGEQVNIPIKMVYDLTATWAHQMDADGVIASNQSLSRS